MASERRLLGYVVKLPDGTRSPHTPEPVALHAAHEEWVARAGVAGAYLSPVFAVRKPKPAPVVEAEGRWAVLVTRVPTPGRVVGAFVPVSDLGSIGSYEAARRTLGEASVFPEENAEAVRLFAIGEHEAALEKARREGAEAALAGLRDRFVLERDDAAIDAKERGEPDYVKGITWAIDVLDRAAKGQAK